MPPGKYNDNRLIHRIAQECGLAVSSVYGILSGEPGYSSAHRARVLELARAYGLSAGLPPEGGTDMTVGILIPKLPGYFWNEAIAGMKKAVALYHECGVRVRPVFSYFPPDLFEDTDEHLIERLSGARCDGYILYPLLRERLWRFITSLADDVPVLIFNDRPAGEEQRHFFDARTASAYVGADPGAEGEQAAAVMKPHLLDTPTQIVALLVGPEALLSAGTARIEGFASRMKSDFPQMNLETLPIEVTKKTAASVLAGELEHRLLQHRLDGVYVSSGFTSIAAGAIRKLCRKHGRNECSIPCIGHELSPSDKPYLLDGVLQGYVRQDIAYQGQLAVRQVVEMLLHGTPMKDTVLRSSVYVKDCTLYDWLGERPAASGGAGSPAGRSKIVILPNGLYEVSDLIDHAVKSTAAVPPKPPRSARYIRMDASGDAAAGTVRIITPDGVRPTAYRLRWGNGSGSLEETPLPECTPCPHEPVTVCTIRRGIRIPTGADRILIWSVCGGNVSETPAAAVIIGAHRKDGFISHLHHNS